MTKRKPSQIHKNEGRSEARRHGSHSHGALPQDLGLTPQLQLEQINRVIQKMISNKDFANTDEINRYLEDEVSMMPIDEILAQVAQDPIERAQDLAYRSMVAESREAALQLARQAVEMDPACVDAQVTIVLAETGTPEATITRLREVVARAGEALGPGFMKEAEGNFWKILETRPFMRAREVLLTFLRGAGRLEEAAAEATAMLELNPGDNQGVRDTLLGIHLEAGHQQRAEALMARYPNDSSAIFRWGTVLAHLLAGRTAAAEEAFAKAMETNPYFFDYLTARLPFPESPPTSHTPGGPSEAAFCMLQLGPVWIRHPQAMAWLEAHPYRFRHAA